MSKKEEEKRKIKKARPVKNPRPYAEMREDIMIRFSKTLEFLAKN